MQLIGRVVMLRWIVLAMLASPAMGQDLTIIDYDALFRDKAADVLTSDEGGQTVRTLTLPEGVTVRDDANAITGVDQSAGGAVGCMFMIFVELGDALQACPALGTAEERGRFDQNMKRVGTFVAENAYRPTTWTALQAQLAAGGPSDPAICERFAEPDMAGLVGVFLGPDMGAQLDITLAIPRLPVNDPCP